MFKQKLKEAYDSNNVSKLFYINGFGGSGKTYFYNTMLPDIRKKEDIAIAMASSGMHLYCLKMDELHILILKIPLKCTKYTTCDI